MGEKWVGSGRGTSILCQDDQRGTPEALGVILAKNSLTKTMEKQKTMKCSLPLLPSPPPTPPAFSWGGGGEMRGDARGSIFPYGALVERARRLRRANQFSPNESSVAQMGAELWPEACFCHRG